MNSLDLLSNLRSIRVFKLASTFSYFLLGWRGLFFEPLGPAKYWTFTAALPLIGLAFLFATRGLITRVLNPGENKESIALPFGSPALVET